MRTSIAVLSCLLMVWITACCCVPSEKDIARYERERIEREAEETRLAEEARERADTFAANYQGVYALIQPGAYTEARACPEDDLLAARGSDTFVKDMWTVDTARLPGAPAAADLEPWKWLNHTHIDYIERMGRGDDDLTDYARELVGEPERQYLAVLVHDGDRVMPGNASKGLLGIGGGFAPGWYAGAVVVVDLAGPSVVCHAPLAATSSDSVDAGDNLDKAITKDFKKNYDEALHVSMESITKVYSADVHGLF